MAKYCESDKNYSLDYSNPKQIIYKMVHDKKTGEEKLVKSQEVDIEEMLEEQQETIEAYIEITKAEVENRKAENLIDLQSDNEFMKELENAEATMNDENIYTIMDNLQTISKVFENLPKEEKEKYKTPQTFVKKGLKEFIKNTKEQQQQEEKIEEEINNKVEIEERIKELEEQLNNNNKETRNNETK